MPTTPDARRRLAELMEDRRLDLGLYWQDVVDAAVAAGFRLSLKTLHSVRAGTAGIRPMTQRAIEAGLQWEHGSIQRIEDGGDPVALSAPPAPVTGPLPVIGLAPPPDPGYEAGATGGLPSADVSKVILGAIDRLADVVRAEVRRQREGGTGEVTFADFFEQLLWERNAPEDDRIRDIATLRLRLGLGPTEQAARRAS